MRILQLISGLNYGGAAALVAQWTKYMDHLSYNVEVCVIYTKGHFAEQLENSGITVHSFDLDPSGLNYHPKGKYALRIIPSLVQLIREKEYEIVHAHLFPTSMFCGVTSLFTPHVKYVFSEHNVYNRRRDHRIFKPLDRLIYQRFVRIIAVSKPVKDALIEWLPNLEPKIQTIDNSIEPHNSQVDTPRLVSIRRGLGITHNQRVILFAGRLLRAKGPDILLSALQKLEGMEFNFKVLIAGEGPLKHDLVDFVTSNSMSDRVVFLGLREDIPLLLDLADLVILPSR